MLAKSLVHTLVIAVVAAVTVPAAADTDSELRTRINRLTPRDLRLRIEVADKKDANTDDKVWVSFNGRSERFYLNHGKIDFKRGDETIYDLPLTHEKIGDLDRLKLGKDGTNGMCVAEMEVTMNDFVVASKSFRNESGGCHWLDNVDGLSRAYTLGSFAPVISRTGRAALVEKLEKNEAIEAGRRDFVLTKKDVEMRLQSSLGHLLQAAGNQVRWGYGGGSSPYAQATAKKDGHDYEVDLDMKLARPTGIEVDVDLYVDFCDGTKPA
ncbi:MAG TPA: PLAT/LH2 domain-containing protein, partial [Labilithrix sp.]|nr:PLAT/LH2 domain-containing protein [Labilithrix sp.]